MDNIIVKACCMFLCMVLNFSVYGVSIDLKIKSLDGSPLEQAGVGVPFLVEVTCPGRDSSVKPQIEGLDEFQVQPAGIKVVSVNGDTTITHSYKVRIDKTGSFIIGPAIMEIDSRKNSSRAVRLSVSENQKIDAAFAAKTATANAFVRLSTDKARAFVGEKIDCTLRFYGIPEMVKLERIEEPKLDRVTVGTKEGPLVSAETVDGVQYTVVTFKWPLTAHKEGQLVLPACAADYLEEQKTHDFLSVFSPFFSMRTERKRTYSNAFTVYIDPLPPYHEPINAIGVFKQYSARIDPVTALEGEGMVLTLDIEGDGDLAAIEPPKLVGIPGALKWYDSKRYIKDSRGLHGLPVKSFEYIVQGISAGSWKIPSQPFTYFDIEKKKFIKLATEEISVTIKSSVKQNGNTEVKEVLPDQETKQHFELLPLSTRKLTYYASRNSRMLPWWIIVMLALLPLCMVVYRMMRYIIQEKNYFVQRTFAFRVALRQIRSAQAHGKIQLLHTIFMDLFALRLEVPHAVLSQDFIEEQLRARQMKQEQIEQWNQFYNHMHEHAFFGTSNTLNDKTIFKEAMSWIAVLEKKL